MGLPTYSSIISNLEKSTAFSLAFALAISICSNEPSMPINDFLDLGFAQLWIREIPLPKPTANILYHFLHRCHHVQEEYLVHP